MDASLASLAIILPGPIPTETARPVASRTRARKSRPMSSGTPNRLCDAVTSMKASSRDSGSTSGLTLSKTVRICALTRRYLAMSPGRKTAWGQSFRAWEVGMAEWTP